MGASAGPCHGAPSPLGGGEPQTGWLTKETAPWLGRGSLQVGQAGFTLASHWALLVPRKRVTEFMGAKRGRFLGVVWGQWESCPVASVQMLSPP